MNQLAECNYKSVGKSYHQGRSAVCNIQSFLKTIFMEKKIEAGKTFEKVQEEFTQTFPYLKLDFVSNGAHATELRLTKENKYDRVDDQISFIRLTETTTVKEIVCQFLELFNLSVKVQRKSDGHWIGTSLTENWTLAKQNIEGKNLANYEFRNSKGD